MTVPVDIPAGTIFGCGSSLSYGSSWEETDKGFALSTTEGDTIILYTRTAGNGQDILPISALSFSGPWLSASDLETNNTAYSDLPDNLIDFSVSLPRHFDNCFYSGPNHGTVEELQAKIRDPLLWTSTNNLLDDPLTILSSSFDVVRKDPSVTSSDRKIGLSLSLWVLLIAYVTSIWAVLL